MNEADRAILRMRLYQQQGHTRACAALMASFGEGEGCTCPARLDALADSAATGMGEE